MNQPASRICSCVEVQFGSYDATVGMKTTRGKWVSIDVCIATEIGRLWMHGVETLNSCCGHGRLPPAVVVADVSIGKMRELGYENDPVYPDRADIFLLTGKALPVKAGNPHYTAWQRTVKRWKLLFTP